jgi:ribosomal protein S18 acetylase RimI-like enzyme
MKVRKASLQDLPRLVEFTTGEAREAEGSDKVFANLDKGIQEALEDDSKAMYWILEDDSGKAQGSISALQEWSDWNAGFYWWIQSVYIVPAQRGKGCFELLLNAVVEEMQGRGGLELRLYVHKDNRRAIAAYKKSAFETLPYECMVLKR